MFKNSTVKKIILSIMAGAIISCIGIGSHTIKAEELLDGLHWEKGSNIRYRNANIVADQNGNFAYLDIRVKASSDILNNPDYKRAYSTAVENWHAIFSNAPVYSQDVSSSNPATANVSVEFETDPTLVSQNPNAETMLFDANENCVSPNYKYTLNGEFPSIDVIRKYYNCPTDNLLIKIKSAKIIINKNVFHQYNDNQRVALIMHELGHALGMGHTDIWSSIMNPRTIKTTQYLSTNVEPKDRQDLIDMYKDFKLNDYSWNDSGWIQK